MSEQAGEPGIGPEVLQDIPAGAPGVSIVRAVANRMGVEPNLQIRAGVETAPTGGELQLGTPDASPAAPQEPASGGPQPSRFNLEAHQDELVEVQVGSESTTVRVSDMVGGFMRNADYTRKAQALAEDRRKLDSGQPEEERQMLELGRRVASSPEAVQALREVLAEGGSEPEDATERRVQSLERKLAQRESVEDARRNLDGLLAQHPEAQDYLGEVVTEMKRAGTKDPVAAWRALDYQNVPERLIEAAEADRLRRAEAASEQSVVNTPTGASASASGGLPTRDDSGRTLSGRDFVRSLLEAS